MPAKKKASERVDKRYKTKMVIPGQDKPVWITAKTKRELEQKKQQLRQELIEGIKQTDRPFVEVLVEWYNTDKKPNIKATSTRRSWENAINVHILPYFDHRKLCRAVTHKDLVDCMEHLKGYNATTIELVRSALHNACGYAIDEGLMIRDPSRRRIEVQAKELEQKDALSDEQIDKLFEIAPSQPMGLLVFLLYYTGMRRCEALALQWGDIDWDANMIHVQRDLDYNEYRSKAIEYHDLKTDAGDRYVPMPADLTNILRPIRGLPNIPIINNAGQPYNFNKYSYEWGKIMIAAGFAHLKESYYDKVKKALAAGKKKPSANPRTDYTFDFSPHWFRHTYITACVLADIPPEITMRIVGHADYKTTINIYTHIKKEIIRKQTVSLSGVLRQIGKVDKKLTSV